MDTNRKHKAKLSRRELASASAALVLAPAVQAQNPPDLAKTIRDAQQRNADAIAKFDVPIATEPAFQFKA